MDELIAWEWHSCLSPFGTTNLTKALYEEYKAYVGRGAGSAAGSPRLDLKTDDGAATPAALPVIVNDGAGTVIEAAGSVIVKHWDMDAAMAAKRLSYAEQVLVFSLQGLVNQLGAPPVLSVDAGYLDFVSARLASHASVSRSVTQPAALITGAGCESACGGMWLTG